VTDDLLRTDVTVAMAGSGSFWKATEYLMGNHTIAERMLHHDPDIEGVGYRLDHLLAVLIIKMGGDLPSALRRTTSDPTDVDLATESTRRQRFYRTRQGRCRRATTAIRRAARLGSDHLDADLRRVRGGTGGRPRLHRVLDLDRQAVRRTGRHGGGPSGPM
jgi:hypothetical protein